MRYDEWLQEALDRIISDAEREAELMEHQDLVSLLDRLASGEDY